MCGADPCIHPRIERKPWYTLSSAFEQTSSEIQLYDRIRSRLEVIFL